MRLSLIGAIALAALGWATAPARATEDITVRALFYFGEAPTGGVCDQTSDAHCEWEYDYHSHGNAQYILPVPAQFVQAPADGATIDVQRNNYHDHERHPCDVLLRRHERWRGLYGRFHRFRVYFFDSHHPEFGQSRSGQCAGLPSERYGVSSTDSARSRRMCFSSTSRARRRRSGTSCHRHSRAVDLGDDGSRVRRARVCGLSACRSRPGGVKRAQATKQGGANGSAIRRSGDRGRVQFRAGRLAYLRRVAPADLAVLTCSST